MIRPKPGTPTWRALDLIATYPDELTPADIAAHLWPPEKRGPFTSTADYAAWRRARTEAETGNAGKASRICRRLAEAGYIRSNGAPVISDWFALRLARMPLTVALRRVAPIDYGDLERHAFLVEKVAKGPQSVAGILGASPSGNDKRVWRELCAWGVVVAPGRRSVTPKGQALLKGAS